MKRIVFLLLLMSWFICPGLSPAAIAQNNKTKTTTHKTTEKSDSSDGVDSVFIDTYVIYTGCPFMIPDSKCSRDKSRIAIKTFSETAEKNNLNYYYIISAGKIIGQGANVVWDLLGAKQGEYKLLVRVGKNEIIRGKTVTKFIQVWQCDCDLPCRCPTLSVSAPIQPDNPGGAITFTANVTGGTQDSPTYDWTVSEGKIIDGQGTSQIVVQTTPEMAGKSVTATVEIGGLCPDCNRTASATGQVAEKKP